MGNLVDSNSKTWWWTCGRYKDPSLCLYGPFTYDECLLSIGDKHFFNECFVCMQNLVENSETPEYGDVIKVTWKDAVSMWGWHAQDRTDEEIKEGLSLINSVGIYMETTEEALCLTHGTSSTGNHDGLTLIPLKGIVEIKVLEKKEK